MLPSPALSPELISCGPFWTALQDPARLHTAPRLEFLCLATTEGTLGVVREMFNMGSLPPRKLKRASPLAASINAALFQKPCTTVGTRKEDSPLNIEVGPNSPPVGLGQAHCCGASATTGIFMRSTPTLNPSWISCAIKSHASVRRHSPQRIGET
jgi:hypothetical protein